MRAAMRNFHLPLPDPLYQRLRDAAERTNQPATALARYAIDHWLRQQRKAMVQQAIAAYAAEMAGTTDDLDPDLEAAALDELGRWAAETDAPSRSRPGKRGPAYDTTMGARPRRPHKTRKLKP